ncbi:MAG: site-specific tyrosine recombinase XerC [Candidatus Riflebacteria bacterium]|nr:site-specific tyrosine recombinase XerC [Candidatus Riflebacteria bacterium]
MTSTKSRQLKTRETALKSCFKGYRNDAKRENKTQTTDTRRERSARHGLPYHAVYRLDADKRLCLGYSGRSGKIFTVVRNWLDVRGITKPLEVTRPILERYQRYLYHYRKKDGMPLAFRSQTCHIQPIMAFFRWLARNNHILSNPAADLELPRRVKQLPRTVLSIPEVERVLSQINLKDPLGIRDRAIFEIFYSTGIRRGELVNLKLFDVDAARGVLFIREGKGWKDRTVPIGERALAWLDKYLREVRPSLVVPPDDGTIFLTKEALPFHPDTLTEVGRAYVEAANLGKKGSCHIFRHSMATLMLEGGADIRFIQQMLGHSNLNTTQIYTQVSIRKLQEIFKATHPGANLKRNPERFPESEEEGDGTEETTEEEKEALLSSLADEAQEEEKPEAPLSLEQQRHREQLKNRLGHRLKLKPGEEPRKLGRPPWKHLEKDQEKK